MRAAAAGGGKTFAGAGVEHHAQFGAAGADQGGGQGKMGQAVDEIIGAVDRIDHPQPALRVCAPQRELLLVSHLFAQHRRIDNFRQPLGKRRL